MGVVPHRLPGGNPVQILLVLTNTDSNLITMNAYIFITLNQSMIFLSDNMIIEQLKKSKVNIFFSSYMTSCNRKVC